MNVIVEYTCVDRRSSKGVTVRSRYKRCTVGKLNCEFIDLDSVEAWFKNESTACGGHLIGIYAAEDLRTIINN